jgi:hypothetical protein
VCGFASGEVSGFGVVALGVAPVDVGVDQACLGGVVGVVGAGEAEGAEAFELRFDPVEPGGVVGCVGEFDVVVGRPGAQLVAFVWGEVVEHEGEPCLGRVAGADTRAEVEELDSCLVLGGLGGEQVGADVEGAEQVADALGAAVGGVDPAWFRPWRPRFAARLGLQVERPELVQADDRGRVVGPRLGESVRDRVQLEDPVFLRLEGRSFERFQLLRA